jgi:hypothetical protein
MKPKTRDNLIYLAVGLSIAGFVVARFLYAESHGNVIGKLSTFAFRVVTTLLLLAYFVAREVHKMKTTLSEVIICVLVAGLLSLLISFGFRLAVGQLSGILYTGFASLEILLIIKLITWVVSHFRRVAHS